MKIGCVIPLYNHSATVLGVAEKCRRYLDDVRVIDDGSSDLDADFPQKLAAIGVKLISHRVNLGKGAALQTAAKILAEESVDSMIVIDADGQHDPGELPEFIRAIESDPEAVVIGCRDFNTPGVPGSSRFGRKFSNFWCRVETGITCDDTQSGFRAYPVKVFSRLKFYCRRYNFEIEVLVKMIWAGCRVIELPIRVDYCPQGGRITHFKPFKDNFLLSVLHTSLVLRRLLPFPHRKLVERRKDKMISFLRHPVEFLKYLLSESATPGQLAAAAAVGTSLAVLPLIGVHMAVIFYVCWRFKLNKVMALGIQNLFMPPLSPFLCIELGYFFRHQEFLKDFTFDNCVAEMHLRVWEWLLGSLILAPLFAVICGTAVYFAALFIDSRRRTVQ